MIWRRVLITIGQVGAVLLPYAVELGKQWFESRKNTTDETEQEEHLAQMLSEQQEQLLVEIEQARQLVGQLCPDSEDAVRYLTLAEAFLPHGLDTGTQQGPDGDCLHVSLSAKEVFKVRLTDLPVAFRYVQMAKEIAESHMR